MKRFIIPICLLLSAPVSAFQYSVEAVGENNIIINGESYSFQTWCNVNEGDQVTFIEGSELGVCTSAKIYDHTTSSTCDLWCE